ncbi:unnamed protein product, partial [Polarella glacialis]
MGQEISRINAECGCCAPSEDPAYEHTMATVPVSGSIGGGHKDARSAMQAAAPTPDPDVGPLVYESAWGGQNDEEPAYFVPPPESAFQSAPFAAAAAAAATVASPGR